MGPGLIRDLVLLYDFPGGPNADRTASMKARVLAGIMPSYASAIVTADQVVEALS